MPSYPRQNGAGQVRTLEKKSIQCVAVVSGKTEGFGKGENKISGVVVVRLLSGKHEYFEKRKIRDRLCKILRRAKRDRPPSEEEKKKYLSKGKGYNRD